MLIDEKQVEVLESPEFREEFLSLIDEQRNRLSAKGAWWPDLVFFVRDIRGITHILDEMDQQELARQLSRVVGATMEKAFKHLYPGSTDADASKKVDELAQECEVLDAVLEQRLSKLFGEQEKEH